MSVIQDNDNQVLKYARWYVSQGLSVIPIRPHDKIPLAEMAIKPYQRQRLPTDSELLTWFKGYPDRNIAICTGRISGVFVLDLDDRALYETLAVQLPVTATVRTARGYHCYFRCPDLPLGNRVQVNKQLFDIRGDGGYCVAPPSIHETGARYEWVYAER